MVKVHNTDLFASGKRFFIIASRFNDFITSKLVDGAIDCILRHRGTSENIEIIWVPGAYELPLIADLVAKTKKPDAIICLGAVIRGSTSHYDLVAGEAAKGISKVALDNSIPTIFGVLTTESIEQAIERAGTKMGNKGWECALSAIEMANLIETLK